MINEVADDFAAAVGSGRLDLPRPGSGRTYERWAVLADLAGEDLSLARLAEGRADALAIVAELSAGPVPDGSRWGVWAAQPPGPGLTASRAAGGWRLDGIKRYCSGARSCTHALVTAAAPDGTRLFAVGTDDLAPVAGTWPATGMAGSDTLDVEFTGIPGEAVGGPGSYTDRPGFAHGGAGVAACWYGGARAVGRTLLAAAAKRDVGPHALSHLGAVDIALHTTRDALERAAAEIDADPGDRERAGWRRTLRVRALVEATATEVMERVGRALGAGPLCHDEAHGRRVADLTVYLRQHHAERDLADLGALAAEAGAFVVMTSPVPNRIDRPGTQEYAWDAWPELRQLPEADPTTWPGVVVVAAHPDDEVLGAGGTIAILAAAGVPVRLVAVTDGEGSHPDADPAVIARTRVAETAAALGLLGASGIEVVRLGFPDTGLAGREEELAGVLGELCTGFGVCLAPWEADAHADHETAGRAAWRAGRRTGARVLTYPIWMWHWAMPGDRRVPWPRACQVRLPAGIAARKRAAVSGAFTSQLTDRGPDTGPVLPAGIVAHFTRTEEVLLR